MIYDCFTFFNELDLLEIRLNVLKDVVDKFVIVEAEETHTGKPKPLYFKENASRFAAFADRIIYINFGTFPKGNDAWTNENLQRNAIEKGLVDASPDDIVLISDLDEIPDPKKVGQYAGVPGIKRFRMDSFAFYLNYMDVRCRTMCAVVMLRYADLCTAFDGVKVSYNEFMPASVNQGNTITKIRRTHVPQSKMPTTIVKRGGWHFTCLGGAEKLVEKIRAVAPHHDFNPDDPSLTRERIEAMIARGEGPALKINAFAVPLDDRFPRYIYEHAEKYSHLIFQITDEYEKRVRWLRLFRTMQGRLIQFAEFVLFGLHIHGYLHKLRMALLKWRNGSR